MSEQIKRTDIAEEGVLDNLIKPLTDLKTLLDGTDKQLKDFASTIQDKLNFGDKAKELREFAEAEKQLNEEYNKKKVIQRATMDADNEILKLKEKLNQLTSNEAKTIADLKVQISEQNKELRQNVKAVLNNTEAYSQFAKETRDAKNESKELGAQLKLLERDGKENTEQYKQLALQYRESTERASQLDKELKELDKSVGDNFRNVGNYESALEALNKEVASGTLGHRELRKRIKDYQDIAIRAGKTSPIGKQAIQDASVLQDQLDSLSNQTKALADDGANMKAALTFGTAITQGYQGVLSIQALLGVKSEKLLEILTKIQATQGVLNSLNAIRNALDKDSILVLKAKTMGQKLYNWVLKGTATATKGATTATKGLNVAMRALPLVAVVAGLTALVSWFAKSKKEIEESTENLKQFKEQGDLTEIISNIERLQRGFQGVKNEIKDLQNLTNLNRISNRKSLEEQLRLAKEVTNETETQTKALFGQTTTIDDLRNALRIANRAQAGYKLTLEELTTGQEIFKDSSGRINKELIETSKILVAQHDEASNLIFDINKKIIEDQKNTSKETVIAKKQMQADLSTLEEEETKDVQKALDDRLKIQEEDLQREALKRRQQNIQNIDDQEEFNQAELANEVKLIDDLIQLRKDYGKDTLELEVQKAELLQEFRARELEDSKDSILTTVDDIANAISDIYNQATDNAINAFKRQEEGAKRMYGTFEKLAVEGNITAQQSMAEMQERIEAQQRKQMQMEQRKLRMQQAQQVSSILLNQLEQGKTPGEALAAAGAFLATSKTLLASLPSFKEGTEMTTAGNLDKDGGHLAILHKGERVMTEGQNKLVGNLSNPVVADIAYKYRTGQLSDSAGNSYDLIRLESKLSAIEQAIQNQPQQVVGLEETLSGMVEMMVKNIKGNHTKTTIYKS